MRKYIIIRPFQFIAVHMSRVSCQKGPTRHAYAWQIGPFWQDTLDVSEWTGQSMCPLVVMTSSYSRRDNAKHLGTSKIWHSILVNFSLRIYHFQALQWVWNSQTFCRKPQYCYTANKTCIIREGVGHTSSCCTALGQTWCTISELWHILARSDILSQFEHIWRRIQHL